MLKTNTKIDNEYWINEFLNEKTILENKYNSIKEVVIWKDYLNHYLYHNLYAIFIMYFQIASINPDLLNSKIDEIKEYIECFYEIVDIINSEKSNSLLIFLKKEFELTKNWVQIWELEPIKAFKKYKKIIILDDYFRSKINDWNSKLDDAKKATNNYINSLL